MTFTEYFPDAGFGLILIAMLVISFVSFIVYEKLHDAFNKVKPRLAVFLAKIIYHEDWSDKLR